MNVIGISAHFHESACCLLQNGRLVAAAEEERFSRIKHDPALPVSAFRYCLDAGRIGIVDIDAVAYYESPVKKLARQLWAGRLSEHADPRRPEREIRDCLGYEGPIRNFEHHQSHAASSFFYSGFEDAAILTVDGVGEWATTTYGHGRDGSFELFETVEFPHSLGLLYSTLTAFLGFEVNSGEYKVMGLAPYGEARFLDQMRRLIRCLPEGQYELDLDYFDFLKGRRMYSERLPELFGQPPREPGSEITSFHEDVARSLQVVLEEVLLEKVDYLHRRTGSKRLCLAGGVALNCVANGRIRREGPFQDLFVQPSAGDAGGALGAASLLHRELTGKRGKNGGGGKLQSLALGPSFSAAEVGDFFDGAGIDALDFRGKENDLLDATAERLSRGEIVGWFQGPMELGPRALGGRSLLADPRDPEMRERMNRLVKKREAFRPFAPSVLLAEASAHFDLDHPSPFMLETCAVRSPLALPAVTHVDGSARPQTVDPNVTPRFAKLLQRFHERTGCPMLLNTSFNVRDEPIVCTPMDALSCLILAGIDTLVIEDFILDRERLPDSVQQLVRYRSRLSKRQSAISTTLYTFV